MKSFISILALFLATSVLADIHSKKARLEAILEKVEHEFEPLAQRRKFNLVYRIGWDKKKLNAHANLGAFSENRRVISINGEAARRGLNDDALLWPICHELGHHFGGEPFYGEGLSAEGPSDYWAAQSCLPRLFKSQFADTAPVIARDSEFYAVCAQTLAEETETQNCARILKSAYDYAFLVQSEMDAKAKPPRVTRLSYETPDPTIAPRTYLGHPKRQCRLDTVLAAVRNLPPPACWFKSYE